MKVLGIGAGHGATGEAAGMPGIKCDENGPGNYQDHKHLGDAVINFIFVRGLLWIAFHSWGFRAQNRARFWLIIQL